MSAEIVKLPENSTPINLAKNLVDLVEEGNVAWIAMVIVSKDGSIRHEWTRLPSALAAIGAVDLLKDRLKQHT